jgi:hypothetical protein
MFAQQCTPCVRWTARALAVVVVGFVSLTLIGEGGFNPFRLTAGDAALMLCFWTAVAGLVVAWWSESVGGALTVGGMLLFYAVHWSVSGQFPRGWYFGLIALPGLLFLFSAALDRRRARPAGLWRGLS